MGVKILSNMILLVSKFEYFIHWNWKWSNLLTDWKRAWILSNLAENGLHWTIDGKKNCPIWDFEVFVWMIWVNYKIYKKLCKYIKRNMTKTINGSDKPFKRLFVLHLLTVASRLLLVGSKGELIEVFGKWSLTKRWGGELIYKMVSSQMVTLVSWWKCICCSKFVNWKRQRKILFLHFA